MATDKRVRAVYVRVSEKDWRRLRELADALGMSVGGVVWGWCQKNLHAEVERGREGE